MLEAVLSIQSLHGKNRHLNVKKKHEIPFVKKKLKSYFKVYIRKNKRIKPTKEKKKKPKNLSFKNLILQLAC